MKIANLFLITALVGVVAAIGCSEDSNGTAGTGGSGTAGTGGSGGADACTGGQCADADVKARCEEGVEYCKSLGAGGAGGAGGAPTEEQCDAAGGAFCNIDTGAGGEGGGGGNPGNCDWTVDEVCNVDTCDEDDQVDACKSRFEDCLLGDDRPSGNFCEKCAVAAIGECGLL
jgi:hypothetical protein